MSDATPSMLQKVGQGRRDRPSAAYKNLITASPAPAGVSRRQGPAALEFTVVGVLPSSSPEPIPSSHCTTLAARGGRLPLAPPDEPAPPSLRGGARLPIVERDAYAFSGELARGGIGRVQRACHAHLQRPVAVKELLFDADPVTEERFVREALLTARLQHPSIVPVYEAGRWPSGEPFYAMKLVEGRSLAEVLLQTKSLADRLALLPNILALAEAMAYAHSQAIIHRDLKPANVLVGEFGETLVIDWGLGKDLKEEGGGEVPPSERPNGPPSGDPLTVDGDVMGTPAYMPPEQALGEQVDARADVYALGAILYHVLGGAAPYEGRSAGEILGRVVSGAMIPLENRQRGLPDDLIAIVRKAMAREPAERYPSARELAEDLRRFQTGQIVGAHRYSRLELVARFARRFRAPLAVASAALLLLAITSVIGVHRVITERDRAEVAQHDATRRADALTLEHARAAALRDPNEAIAWLKTLSPSFTSWRAARVIAADAKEHGISTALRGHDGAINGVAFSPDGRTLATSSDDHSVRLWDLATGKSRLFEGHTDEAWVLVFSRDGQRLACAGKDKTVRVWEVETGVGRVLTGHEGPVSAIGFSPDGERLVSGSFDGTVRVWELGNGERRVFRGHTGIVRSVALSPDGKRALSGGFAGMVWLWDLTTGEGVRLERGARRIAAVAFSPNGKLLAARGMDATVLVWDAATGAQKRLEGTTKPQGALSHSAVGAIAFSPDGAHLATVGDDAGVRLWNLETGQGQILEGHQGRTLDVTFSPDGTRLASGGYDRTVRLWDVATGKSRVFYGFDDAVTAVDFSPDGESLAAGAADHGVRVFRVSAAASRVLTGHADAVTAAHFSSDGGLLVTAARDGTARVWDLAGGPTSVLRGHVEGALRAAVSPGGELIATAGLDGTAQLWDRAGTALRTFHAHVHARSPLAFSPRGGRLAFASSGGAVIVADLEGTEERVLAGHDDAVLAAVFSPDGKLLATAGLDRTVRLWDLASGEQRALRGHEDAVLSLAFAPDGSTLASGSSDHTVRFWSVATGASRTIDACGSGVTQILFAQGGRTAVTISNVEASVRLWDVATGAALGLLRGHAGEVVHLALSPDGDRLATASVDRTVRLWDLPSGDSRVLQSHTGAVLGVAFSPDGRTIASASEDGTARLWADDLPESGDALRAWLRAATPDVLPPDAASTAPEPRAQASR